MKEIEFRAWDMINEKMVTDQREIYYYLGSTKEERMMQRPHIFMQFTGLVDSKGKKIFEGDIIQFTSKGEKSDVYSIVKDYIFDTVKLHDRQPYWDHNEVIGDIYSNPELLTPNNK